MADGLAQCLPTDPLARAGAGVDCANLLEGLIE